ncbi:HI0074 family nucleotidyltransferase substrate-binding subunit [uncultured Megasphaera sp.]|uniref:HI0074 family nucleotidyltransferase substrate-binding subunit n=1 Tax=uncultured Megasphaera sp. TaxID=165188 RepID=UPI0025DF434A|nr:HI0074 family nucleotidyltransferase substrate-binding subunit [uncultured Megasphaera sp.]
MYGLSVRQWRQIFAILSRYGSRIDWVKLFGSRARGDYKPVSDVDLAIASAENLVTRLQLDFDQSQLPFTFDLIDYRRQPNQKLQDAIDREGKLLWAVDDKGEWMMTKEQLLLKWEDYHKALHRLEIALTKTLDEDDLYLDATIQRFEFTFELAWKLMKAVLEYEGIETTSPRSSIREAWKQHLINDAEKWLDMQVKRNLSSHTYNEETAQDIYRHIKEDYIGLLQALDQEVRSRLDI